MISFNEPCIVGKELEYIRQAVQGAHISGNGPFTRKCEAWLEEKTHCQKALLTTSCTSALEMAGILLDIGPGDEVIVPSFTFVSTANAFALRGAQIRFADIRPDTLNLDENLLAGLITPRTKAVVPVHYAGVGCAMEAILDTSARAGISVVEDNAHGLLGRYKGRDLGSFGCMATLSFHETKNLTCGEGGALLINDPAYVERAEVVREKGTDRSRFFRGLVDKYTWMDIGSSYLPADLLAAFLYAQCEASEQIQASRKRIWSHYYSRLESWARSAGVRLPVVPEGCEQPYHMFYLLMPSLEERQALIARLKSQGIHSVFHYIPLHLCPMGQRFGGAKGQCPVTEDVSERLVRLPFYNTLSEQDQDMVVRAIQGPDRS